MAELIVQAGRSIDLEGKECTIGRALENRLVLDDPTISAYHAVITRVDGVFTVRDLKSSNGMKVNGTRVSEAKLASGDRIKFGAVECEFQAGVSTNPPAAEAVAPRSAASSSLLYRLFSGPGWICPVCRSDDLESTKAKAMISVSGDRLCRSCGAAWAPPVPKWAASLMCVILAGFCIFTILSMQHRWQSEEESAKQLADFQKRSDEMRNDPLMHVLEPGWQPRASTHSPPVVHRHPAQTALDVILALSFTAGAVACIPVLLGKTGKLKMYRSGNPSPK